MASRWWSKSLPSQNGWHFWKKRKNINNPLFWRVIYVDEENFWEGSHLMDCPRGGGWAPIQMSEPMYPEHPGEEGQGG